MVTRYDRASLRATKTPEGFIVDAPILSRVGVFEYRQPDGTIRKEFRPPAEVFSAEHLDSLYGKPITDEHHGLVTATSRVPRVGAVLSKGRQDTTSDLNLVADITIHDPSPVDAGKKELSLGYSLDLDETPGEWNGQRYDAVQKNLRVNHVALVARGRAGNSRLNLDAADAVAAIPEEDDKTMSLVKVRLDSGIEYDAAPEVLAALNAANASKVQLQARADQAESQRDTLQAKVDAHDAAIKTAREDGRRDAQNRLTLEAQATEIGAKFAQDASDGDIRKAVIKHVRGDSVDLTGKSDAYIDAAYDMAYADGKKAKANGASARADSRDTTPAGGGQGGTSAAAARQAYATAMFNPSAAKA